MILLGVGAGIATIGVLGYRYWHYTSTHQTTDNAIVTGHIHQISSRVAGTVTEILVRDNQQVEPGQLLAKLDPRDYQNKVLQAQVALESARRQASAAQANIILATQTTSGKTTQAQGDVNSAKAAIVTAQANVNEAQAGISAAQAVVSEAKSGVYLSQTQVVQNEASLEKAKADYVRYSSLYRQGVTTRQQLETMTAAYRVAEAQRVSAEQGVQQSKAQLTAAQVGVTKARSQLVQAQTGVSTEKAKLEAFGGGLQQAKASGQQIAVNQSQFKAAQSAIAQANIALKDALLQLSYMKISAPSAGKIGKKNVEIGNRIQIGTPLMVVVDNDYWVVANFKETQLGKLKSGQLAEIKLDGLPNHTFSGHIDSISPASGAQFSLLPPDNATGNFTKIVQRIPVKIRLDPKSFKGYDAQIRPGMSAEVSVEIK